MTTIQPLRADTGLCEYEDPDTWFRGYSGERESAAICTNCPIIVACAQNALRFGATDGWVWASVAMPGARDVAALKAARAQLREVIARYRNQPPALRLRSLQIRQAVHFAATQRDLRRRQAAKPASRASATLREKASA